MDSGRDPEAARKDWLRNAFFLSCGEEPIVDAAYSSFPTWVPLGRLVHCPLTGRWTFAVVVMSPASSGSMPSRVRPKRREISRCSGQPHSLCRVPWHERTMQTCHFGKRDMGAPGCESAVSGVATVRGGELVLGFAHAMDNPLAAVAVRPGGLCYHPNARAAAANHGMPGRVSPHKRTTASAWSFRP